MEKTASLVSFRDGSHPEATIDLTPVFGGMVDRAHRKFIKDSPVSITIEDDLKLSTRTQQITWQMLTQADVKVVESGAILSERGKRLRLSNLSHPNVPFSVVSLDPPPHKLDRQWPGLKRIELRLSPRTFKTGDGPLRIRLAGM